MKLAEALILRADCQKRFEQLKQRIVRSAKVQEGDKPPENPRDLIDELERVASELADLIQRINRTNSGTVFQGNKTLSDALAERDVLAMRRGVYADLAQAASVTQDRYSRSEVKFQSTVNVSEIQKRADELSKAYRELDARIQEINWKTDLVE
ncbi:MAG TPA: DIP1984 family protein [Blastocatellia bacterium]|nr:DIP1984 family protein [Blastocatellia bacterium]